MGPCKEKQKLIPSNEYKIFDKNLGKMKGEI
jgi:hypothetical protein